jgi:hypothetical protein
MSLNTRGVTTAELIELTCANPTANRGSLKRAKTSHSNLLKSELISRRRSE